MERIVYRKTLDVHKNGIQFVLQGFETADKMARRIEVNLTASGDVVEIPEGAVAMMYISSPNSGSIERCEISDNTIIYDVLPITAEGTTEMQLKIIETSAEGAQKVLMSPRFSVEVLSSGNADEDVVRKAEFTLLEDAVAKAEGTYNSRLLRIDVDEKRVFRAYYADGTVYETDVLRESLLNGESLMAKSYAVGGTGLRENENKDNAKYYSDRSKSSSSEAVVNANNSSVILEDVRKHGIYTAFAMDFESGELLYESPKYKFNVDETSGDLVAEGEAYSFEDVLKSFVAEGIAPGVAEMLKGQLVVEQDAPLVSDLGATFDKPTVVRWDSNTAMTPYSSGDTDGTSGSAIVYGDFSGNHVIAAWVNGDTNGRCYFIHSVVGGSDKGWNSFVSVKNGVIEEKLEFNYRGVKHGEIASDSYLTRINSIYDGNNERTICVANPLLKNLYESQGISGYPGNVYISEIVNGINKTHELFGAHNVLDALIGKYSLGCVEFGSFKGIGLEEAQKGTLPSVTLTKIADPKLVLILAGDKIVFLSEYIQKGIGIGFNSSYSFGQTFRDGMIMFKLESYTNGTNKVLINSNWSTIQSSLLDLVVADNSKTYYYIAFGGAKA